MLGIAGFELCSLVLRHNRSFSHFKADKVFLDENAVKEPEEPDFQDKININSASREEILLLPNVNEELADRLIEARNKNKFLFMEDLLTIKGIGRALLERLKPYAYVR